MSKKILVDETHDLFDTQGMFYKEFPSDFSQIRYFTLLIVQKAPPEIRDRNILEQQISEIIKNATKHGNRCDHNKKVRVWYQFSRLDARLIVEDEGEGFQEIEAWNSFNERRNSCLEQGDFEALAELVTFRTARSDENDGGNAMFAALEYWDQGLVFNAKRNKVAVARRFNLRSEGFVIGAA